MLKFSKLREGAKIPSKRVEDAAYDLYACFDDDCIQIKPNEIKFIPTGVACAFNVENVMLLRERGSTGSKGMSLRCGVIDSGYRNEIFVAINNTSNKTIYIAKKEFCDHVGDIDKNTIIYPYEKALAQFIMTLALHFDVEEVPYEELQKIESERGMGKLGSSGK